MYEISKGAIVRPLTYSKAHAFVYQIDTPVSCVDTQRNATIDTVLGVGRVQRKKCHGSGYTPSGA